MSVSSTTSGLPVSLIVVGFFSVRAGERVSTKKDTTTVYHQHYRTAISCASGHTIDAMLRVYSPMGDQSLPDNSVVMTVAKAVFPANGQAFLDAIHFVPFPGDPSAQDYEDRIPNFVIPVVFGLGHVSGTHQTLDDSSRSFPVTCGDYIKTTIQTCTIQCVYNGAHGNKRWASTQIPKTNSCIQFSGTLREVASGTLRVNLDHIVLNVAPRGTVQSDPVPSSTSSSSPASHKKRKFASAASDAIDISASPSDTGSTSPELQTPSTPSTSSRPSAVSPPEVYTPTGHLSMQSWMTPPPFDPRLISYMNYAQPPHAVPTFYPMPGLLPSAHVSQSPLSSMALNPAQLPMNVDSYRPSTPIRTSAATDDDSTLLTKATTATSPSMNMSSASASIPTPASMSPTAASAFSRSAANPYAYPMTQRPLSPSPQKTRAPTPSPIAGPSRCESDSPLTSDPGDDDNSKQKSKKRVPAKSTKNTKV